jgi:hypothetical protein
MRRLQRLALPFVCSLVLLAPARVLSSAPSDALVGKWTGTFAGDSAGKVSLAIAANASQAFGGTIDVVPDGGDGYTATLKTVTIDGGAVKMAYDSPDGAPVEIQMDAALDGATLKGTWTMISTNSKEAMASGTFTCSKP